MIRSLAAAAAIVAACFAIEAAGAPPEEESASPAAGLKAVEFLAGAWRGGDAFVFEEIWSQPEGGVMTGMARGVKDGELAVLEYIVIAETPDGPVMRFKHFNADYTTWEADAPVVLHLEAASEGRARFVAPDAGAEVQAIEYSLDEKGGLTAEVSLLEEGEARSFTLSFERVE